MDDLHELERQGWEALSRGEGAAFYGRLMTGDALVVVPGAVLDREQTLRSWEGVAPWQEFRLDDARVVPLSGESAVLTYVATARRDGDSAPYRALCSSVYVRRGVGWALAFHQQTPLP